MQYTSSETIPEDKEPEECYFSQNVALAAPAFIDIVAIVPYETSWNMFSGKTNLICECLTSMQETYYVFMSEEDYKENIDPDIEIPKGFVPSGKEVEATYYSKAKRIHGWSMPVEALIAETKGSYEKNILYFGSIGDPEVKKTDRGDKRYDKDAIVFGESSVILENGAYVTTRWKGYVYSEPSANSSPIGTAEEGVSFGVIEKVSANNKTWYRIKENAGGEWTDAYVESKAVDAYNVR